jgi:L-arabinose isomerase
MTQADHEASNERRARELWTALQLSDAPRAELAAALDAVRDAERERWVEACRVAWKDAHKAATFARSWHGGHSHEAARSHEATADAIHALAKRLGVTL